MGRAGSGWPRSEFFVYFKISFPWAFRQYMTQSYLTQALVFAHFWARDWFLGGTGSLVIIRHMVVFVYLHMHLEVLTSAPFPVTYISVLLLIFNFYLFLIFSYFQKGWPLSQIFNHFQEYFSFYCSINKFSFHFNLFS